MCVELGISSRWKELSKNRKPQAVTSKPGSSSKTYVLLVKNNLQKTKVNVTDWLVKSANLNANENLWGELKTRVHSRRSLNLQELKRFSKEKMGCETYTQDTTDY